MFQDLPILSESYDGHHQVLARAFTYVTSNGVALLVPVGTTTDGASVPQAFWDVLPPFGLYWPATVLHDYLYRNADGLHSHMSRQDCDDLLLEAMISLQVGLVTRTTIYEGVRLGGSWSFEEDRKTLIRGEQIQHRLLIQKMYLPKDLPVLGEDHQN